MSAPICSVVEKCGVAPTPLIDLLAACVIYTEDLAGVPTYCLNVINNTPACENVETFPCSKKDISSEDKVRLVFTCDCCGNLAVNLAFTNCEQ